MGRSPKQTYMKKATEYVQDGFTICKTHNRGYTHRVPVKPQVTLWKAHASHSDSLGKGTKFRN